MDHARTRMEDERESTDQSLGAERASMVVLAMTETEARLQREIEILGQEIEAQMTLQKAIRADDRHVIRPVDTEALGKMASRN